MRLDSYLCENGLAKSRERAKALIKKGAVSVNGTPVYKASQAISAEDTVTLLEEDHPYVSRGAFKLKGILDALGHKFDGKNVIDIGSSTGGFTQIALEYGASHITAVDVGTDQLDGSLRPLAEVTVLEQTDARNLTKEMLSILPDMLVSDVSFISQTRILPHVLAELLSIQQLYILVKPQFELSKQHIGSGGIVREESYRQQALTSVVNCLKANGFKVVHVMDSPISGTDGNQEYILYGERI